MVDLISIVKYCDERLRIREIKDFPGSFNGLQIDKVGKVSKIGASVDAGLIPFEKATENNIDFLVVHHGIFWSPPTPLTGVNFDKVKHCMDHDLAVYSAHLPLDCHDELGNNAVIAKKLNLKPCGTFLNFEDQDIGLLTLSQFSREELKSRLQNEFSQGIQSIEFGSSNPKKIAILSGSGQSAVDQILNSGCDTLITGELKQQHFNYAQENRLNLYACGHYATETFGVQALAEEIAQKFDLPYEFIRTECLL